MFGLRGGGRDLSIDELKSDSEKLQAVKEEIADICIYAIQMTLALKDQHLNEIILEKLAKVEQKYPANIIKERRENYYMQKQKYRDGE